MALATYLCSKAHDKRFTALPVFLTRDFYHAMVSYNVNSGIESPKDLEGKRVGVRSYTFTPGVWTRGILSSEYGVDLTAVTWVLSGDEHVAEYAAPPNVVSSQSDDLGEMLLSGEIDAAIGAPPLDSPDVRPLFSDAAELDAKWHRDTGVYPISHLLVVKDELMESVGGVVSELFNVFGEARDDYARRLRSGDTSAPGTPQLLKMAEIVGDDDALSYDFGGRAQDVGDVHRVQRGAGSDSERGGAGGFVPVGDYRVGFWRVGSWKIPREPDRLTAKYRVRRLEMSNERMATVESLSAQARALGMPLADGEAAALVDRVRAGMADAYGFSELAARADEPSVKFESAREDGRR